MKETNMEHFRGEIEKVLDRGKVIAVSKEDGRIFECDAYAKCEQCICGDNGKLPCDVKLMQWLMSEYKPEPVLTQREKHFVELVQEGWIARDKDGELWWYDAKPKKREDKWNTGRQVYRFNKGMFNFEQCFRFITWEDEAWNIEELRKLKVNNAD